ncbi:MAG: hypothetical protein HRU78_09245 [Gammaproteobacteria bacterium]|nr:MAG: hypothetical protein HRU78_09245 [Gammaproteobacteria bacterium]
MSIKPVRPNKRNLLINIDTVKFFVKDDHENTFTLPKTTTARLTSEDGEILETYQNRVPLPGEHGTHFLHVRTMKFGKKLSISGSPYAFMHGQNVYTSSDMQAAALDALRRVCKAFKIKTTEEQRQRWINGDITLERVDLAVNIKVESEAKAVDILRQIRRQLGEHGSTKTNGTTVYWSPRDGKEFSICFYAKGPQMRKQKRYIGQPFRERLLKDSECIIRIELRLKARELRKLQLDKVSAWDDQTAVRIFDKYMGKLKFLNITSGPVTKEELSRLPSRLRPVWALHKGGQDLSLIYLPRTLRRHKSDFRKLGFDLNCPNQAEGTVIPLTKVLAPSKVINSAPEWMIEEELALPRQKVAAKKS